MMTNEIDFNGKPKHTIQFLSDRYPPDILLNIEDILQSKPIFRQIFQDLIDIMKYGFEIDEVRKRTIHFKFRATDEEIHELQLNHFISNLIFWQPLIDIGQVSLLDDLWIFDFTKFNAKTLTEFINTKLLPIYDVDFASQNAMVDELYHYIISISHAFCLLMGMGVSLYDLHKLEERDPEVSHLMRDPIDETMEPHEVEQHLEERNNRLIDRMVQDTGWNDYKPFFASGTALKKAQFREYIVKIGFKSDINGATVPILINDNFLFNGLSKPSSVFLNGLGGRKALILSKLAMGVPGAFSKKLSFNTLSATLRDDMEVCDSIATVDYLIKDDTFLKMLDGRYFYNEHGELMRLEYEVDKDLIGKVVRFRSPATCNSNEGVCRFCYGMMFNINISMPSAGTLAALKITEPVGQGILSSKHSQTTNSAELQFSEGYDEAFETTGSTISMKDNSELDADMYIRLGPVEVEELDDSEFYSITSFELIDSDGNLYRKIEEANGARFYLNDHLVKMYKAKIRSKNPDPIFSLEDLEDDDDLFTIEVKNKELTDPLRIFTRILNRNDHGGAETISELCQMFAEALIQMGTKYPLVHAEMIVRNLIRRKSDILKRPDFSAAGNPDDYVILKLDTAEKKNPSALVSLPYGYLRKQLLSTELYKKKSPGPLDALYISNLRPYLD